MKKLLLGLLALGTVPFVSGCATPGYVGGWPTLRIPEEKWTGEATNNVLRVWVLENRMMIDDINSALLMDRPSGLSEWHIR